MSQYTRYVSATSAGLASIAAGRERSSDFTIEVEPPLQLAGKAADVKGNDSLIQEWNVALTSFSCFNSIPNIDATLYANNIFTYDPGTGPINVVMDKGNYSIEAIQDEINASLQANALPLNSIVFTPNTATGKFSVTLAAGYSWDLTTSNLHLLLGFTLAQSPVLAGTTTGATTADMTNGITALYLRTNVVSDSIVNGAPSDTLYQYQPNVKPNSALTLDIKTPIYVRCRTNQQISTIRLYVTDNRGRRVDYNGQDVVWGLHFQRVPRKMY